MYVFDFFRFSQLKSLNLSHNRLGVFPESVCEILTLTDLNLSCNGLQTVSVQIGNLQRWDTETVITAADKEYKPLYSHVCYNYDPI